MNRLPRRWILVTAMVVGGCTVSLIVAARGREQLTSHDRALAEQKRDATRGMRGLAFVPVSRLREPDPAMFWPTPPIGSEARPPMTGAERDEAETNAALWQSVRAFVEHRYGPGATGRSYAEWMRSRGFEMRPAEYLRDSWWADAAYEAYHGRPAGQNLSAEDLFLACVEAGDAHEGGTSRIESVSLDSGWVGFFSGTVTRAAPSIVAPDQWPERVLALSGRVSSSPSWFVHPDDLDTQLAAGEAEAGAVWCVARFAGGAVRPVRFGLVRSRAGEWLVTSLSVGCRPGEESVRCEF